MFKKVQNRPDANMMMQLRKFKDYVKKDGEVRTDDMKKIKVKTDDAIKVHDTLMKVKTPIRYKYLQLLQKDKRSLINAFGINLKGCIIRRKKMQFGNINIRRE